MAKETFYFSHDYNARLDIKIQKLIQKNGIIAYGIYWAIIEDLYINQNILPLDYETFAYHLRVDENIVKSIINDFDLFVIEEDFFYSNSVKNRIEIRENISKKNKENAEKRWGKDTDNQEDNATALPTLESGIANEKSTYANKGKESKGNKNKLNKENITLEQTNVFEEARKYYLGSKAGLQTELDNFVKKYPNEWQTILPLLLPAIAREKIDKAQKLKNNNFNQQWKNFSTWINNKCWEIEYPNVTQAEVDSSLKVTTNSNGEQKTEIKEDRSSYPMYQTLKYNPELFPEGTESRCGYWVVKNKQCVKTHKC